jgi:hypothetical protein
MSLDNKVYTLDTGLAEFGSNGFSAALFPQIRDAIANKMRAIYGNDIDISSASADGQYVNAEALIVNNIYRALENIEHGLNPAMATGNQLDILASLMHVSRQYPTRSKVTLYIRPSVTITGPKILKCTDADQNEWVWHVNVDFMNNPTITEFTKDNTYSIDFYCQKLGSVQALSGDTSWITTDTIDWGSATLWSGTIDKLSNKGGIVPMDPTIDYFQPKNAVLGFDEETDSSLRNKMQRQIGMNSVSLTDSLQANLIGLGGVKDVFVLNNNTGTDKTLLDSSLVPNHNVFIAVRGTSGVTLNDAEIGRFIYSYMTPGVLTYFDATNTTFGTQKSIRFSLNGDYYSTIYYKLCSAYSDFTITVNYQLIGIKSTTATQKALIESILTNYLNSVEIGGTISVSKIFPLFISGDLKPTGSSSYFPTSGKITVSGTDYQNLSLPVTYIDGAALKFTWATETTGTDDVSTGVLTITKAA